MKTVIILGFLVISSLLLHTAISINFTLEGIMADPDSPEDSLAVINGNIFKKGDTCEGYTISEIGADYVFLKPQSGGEPVRLSIGPITKTKSMAVSTIVPQEFKAQEESEITTPNQNFYAVGAIGMAVEAKAMAEMRQIFTGCAMLSSMEEVDSGGHLVIPQFDLKKMVERGLIPKYLANGQSGAYAYTIESRGHEYEIYGDPVNPKAKLRHFMIDSDGILHTENGKPATKESPTPLN